VVAVPAPRVEVVDTTGAGDAFIGAMAAALMGGAGMEEAVRRGVAVASLTVGVAGSVPAYPRAADLVGRVADAAGVTP
jgi:ribokinase